VSKELEYAIKMHQRASKRLDVLGVSYWSNQYLNIYRKVHGVPGKLSDLYN